MSDDIQFGELEESVPERQLRPDQNKQFCVVAVGNPSPADLPIYVDMDVALDMERHALSDTTVELGGVMLGRQFEDDEGQPFVVVTDSLRAEHYESTKGSFKFTHETWEAITRRRDEFPDDLQMVGWYHTHPDWGVFLSGMDMFICNNFFNRPLDVALVIDPCRDDRGMFQWVSTETGQQIRETDGFFLTSSHFREAELVAFSQYLQGDNMSHDPRYSSPAGSSGPPVVHIHDQRNQGQGATSVLAAALMLQFVFMVFLAWKLLAPAGDSEDTASKLTKAVAKLEQLERAESAQREAERQLWEAELKLRAVDQALSQADRLAPGELVNAAAEDVDKAMLREQLRSLAAHSQTLNEELAQTQKEKARLVDQSNKTRKSLAGVREKVTDLQKENKQIRTEFKEWKADKATSAFRAMMSDIRWVGGMVLAVVALVVGTVYATVSIRNISESTLADADNGDVEPASESWQEVVEDPR